MTFARNLFRVAGIYGIVVLLPQCFLETKIGRDVPPAITHSEYFYGFVGVGLAWQVLFLLIARDPVRYRLMMLPGTLEKLAFGGACIALYLQGRLANATLGFALIDLVFAALFVVAYRRTPKT